VRYVNWICKKHAVKRNKLLGAVNIPFHPSVQRFDDENRKERKINTDSTQTEVKERMPMNQWKLNSNLYLTNDSLKYYFKGYNWKTLSIRLLGDRKHKCRTFNLVTFILLIVWGRVAKTLKRRIQMMSMLAFDTGSEWVRPSDFRLRVLKVLQAGSMHSFVLNCRQIICVPRRYNLPIKTSMQNIYRACRPINRYSVSKHGRGSMQKI